MAQAQKVPVYSDAVLRKGFVKGPAGLSVADAKAAMETAAEPVTLAGGTFTPKHLSAASPRSATRGQGGNSPRVPYTPAEIEDANESLKFVAPSQAPAIPPRTAAQPPTPAAAHPAAAQPAVKESRPQSPLSHHETFSDLEFVVETYRDIRDGKWYGLINYKPDADGNQPGEERFIADSQAELNLKLLKGKAHGTLKVRSVVRGRKMGGKPELKETHDLEILNLNNLTIPEFNALPDKSKALLRENAYSKEFLIFKDSHPEYGLSSDTGIKNAQAMIGYLNKQGWPTTARNLEIAWNDLEAANKLEIPKPSETVPAIPATPPTPPTPPAPVIPIRKRGSSALVPGGSSGTWANGIDDDGPRARQAANANQNTNMTPERVKELSKTSEGMAQLKREMRSGFRQQSPSYKG